MTGGTGYIGSHTVVALNAAGYVPVIADNLVNSKVTVLERRTAIMGPSFLPVDVRDRTAREPIFQEYSIWRAS